MNKILFMLMISSICLLQACSGNSGRFLYKDDKNVNIYQARCTQDIGDCYKGAGKMCPSGFEIIDWKGYKMYGPITVVGNEKDISETTLVIEGKGKYMTGGGTMLFKCKDNSDTEKQ